MPITPVPVTQPIVTTVPHIVPPGQNTVPEPAKRVTAVRRSTRSDIDPDEKRSHSQGDHSGDRGSTLDVEV